MSRRRSTYPILEQILRICIDGAAMTKIVYGVNLNFKTIRPHLDLLVRNGLLETSRGGRYACYTTTTKGVEALEHLQALEKLLSDAAQADTSLAPIRTTLDSRS